MQPTETREEVLYADEPWTDEQKMRENILEILFQYMPFNIGRWA